MVLLALWQPIAILGGPNLPMMAVLLVATCTAAIVTLVTLRSGIYLSHDRLLLKGVCVERYIEVAQVVQVRRCRVTVFRIYSEFRIEFQLEDGKVIGFPWIGWHDFQSQLWNLGAANTGGVDTLVESLNHELNRL